MCKEDDSGSAFRTVPSRSELDVSFSTAGRLPNLIGGTVFAFIREAAKGALDYLFVDEAGQVSLANLVAMSLAAKNMVLLGDQMQLGQPIRGSHPRRKRPFRPRIPVTGASFHTGRISVFSFPERGGSIQVCAISFPKRSTKAV